jgi:hypothetical protein
LPDDKNGLVLDFYLQVNWDGRRPWFNKNSKLRSTNRMLLKTTERTARTTKSHFVNPHILNMHIADTLFPAGT